MANSTISLTRSQTRRLTKGTWQAWKAGTANDVIPYYLEDDNQYISYRVASGRELGCFKIGANYELLQSITSITINLRFKNTSTNRKITLDPRLRLYNATDPSGGSVTPAYLPTTGLIATQNVEAFDVEAGETVDKSITISGFTTKVETLHLLVVLGMSAAKDTNGYIQLVTQYCTFQGTGPEKTVYLSASPYSVKTGENITVKVSNRAGRTFGLDIKYGDTVLDSYSLTADTTSINCPKSWFTTAGVAALEYFQLRLELSTGFIWDSTYLHAGSDMKPVIGNPAVTIVQPSPASINFPNTFLAGISKAKVAVAVSPGSNAAIRTVTCAYDGGSMTLTYNSSTEKYEGTTPLPLTQSTTFRITAEDQRGMTETLESAEITVVPYTQPAINIDESNTYRCNSSGASVEGGSYYRVKATATVCTVTGLSGNQVEEFVVYLSGDTTEHALTSGVQSAAISASLSSGVGYTFYVRLKDSVGSVTTKSFRLEGSRRYIVLQSNGGGIGVGIGKNPLYVGEDLNYTDLNILSGKENVYETNSGSNLLISGYRINEMKVGTFHEYVTNLLTGVSFGKDFLNIETSRLYSQQNATAWFQKESDDSAWANMPNTMSGKYWVGVRFVLRKAGTTALVVILEWTPTPGRIWINRLSSNGWSGWKYLTPTAEE